MDSRARGRTSDMPTLLDSSAIYMSFRPARVRGKAQSQQIQTGRDHPPGNRLPSLNQPHIVAPQHADSYDANGVESRHSESRPARLVGRPPAHGVVTFAIPTSTPTH